MTAESQKKHTVKKAAWLDHEDKLLCRVMSNLGFDDSEACSAKPVWSDVAAFVTGRTAKQCRERWSYNLSPTINRGHWTLLEDSVLLRTQDEVKNNWALIAHVLPGRNENSVKTRYKSIVCAFQRLHSSEDTSSSPSSPSSSSEPQLGAPDQLPKHDNVMHALHSRSLARTAHQLSGVAARDFVITSIAKRKASAVCQTDAEQEKTIVYLLADELNERISVLRESAQTRRRHPNSRSFWDACDPLTGRPTATGVPTSRTVVPSRPTSSSNHHRDEKDIKVEETKLSGGSSKRRYDGFSSPMAHTYPNLATAAAEQHKRVKMDPAFLYGQVHAGQRMMALPPQLRAPVNTRPFYYSSMAKAPMNRSCQPFQSVDGSSVAGVGPIEQALHKIKQKQNLIELKYMLESLQTQKEQSYLTHSFVSSHMSMSPAGNARPTPSFSYPTIPTIHQHRQPLALTNMFKSASAPLPSSLFRPALASMSTPSASISASGSSYGCGSAWSPSSHLLHSLAGYRR